MGFIFNEHYLYPGMRVKESPFKLPEIENEDGIKYKGFKYKRKTRKNKLVEKKRNLRKFSLKEDGI